MDWYILGIITKWNKQSRKKKVGGLPAKDRTGRQALKLLGALWVDFKIHFSEGKKVLFILILIENGIP
jgi:hypothetical protein